MERKTSVHLIHMRPFHAAYPVQNIQAAKHFYSTVLGCTLGRSTDTWVDLNFFGHQLVFHLDPSEGTQPITNPVDGQQVPVPHFGIILDWKAWPDFIRKLKQHDISFVIEPYLRFEGLPGEQYTCFFYDPNGLALEFKAFKHDDMIFETMR